MRRRRQKAVRTDQGVVTVQRRKRKARLQIVMADGTVAYADLTPEQLAQVGERCDNVSRAMDRELRPIPCGTATTPPRSTGSAALGPDGCTCRR